MNRKVVGLGFAAVALATTLGLSACGTNYSNAIKNANLAANNPAKAAEQTFCQYWQQGLNDVNAANNNPGGESAQQSAAIDQDGQNMGQEAGATPWGSDLDAWDNAATHDDRVTTTQALDNDCNGAGFHIHDPFLS
jgi:hypothetical protein